MIYCTGCVGERAGEERGRFFLWSHLMSTSNFSTGITRLSPERRRGRFVGNLKTLLFLWSLKGVDESLHFPSGVECNSNNNKLNAFCFFSLVHPSACGKFEAFVILNRGLFFCSTFFFFFNTCGSDIKPSGFPDIRPSVCPDIKRYPFSDQKLNKKFAHLKYKFDGMSLTLSRLASVF